MPKKMTRGERVIAFIETFCVVPEGTGVGQPMVLAPFQKKWIKAVYDNKAVTRRAILAIARKNGKTALIASIMLAHIIGPEAVRNSQVVSGAMSRDQAALVFNLAAKMLQLNSDLDGLYRVVTSGKRIIGMAKNVEYRALAADGTTAHGLSPKLAVLDEVGQIKGPMSPFVEAILTSQGAYEDAIQIFISTQASADADFFSMIIDDAERSGDPKTVSHVYCADQNADLMDKRQWKKANPALGIFRSEADLRATEASPAATLDGGELPKSIVEPARVAGFSGICARYRQRKQRRILLGRLSGLRVGTSGSRPVPAQRPHGSGDLLLGRGRGNARQNLRIYSPGWRRGAVPAG